MTRIIKSIGIPLPCVTGKIFVIQMKARKIISRANSDSNLVYFLGGTMIVKTNLSTGESYGGYISEEHDSFSSLCGIITGDFGYPRISENEAKKLAPHLFKL